jgi:hypothetical protein
LLPVLRGERVRPVDARDGRHAGQQAFPATGQYLIARSRRFGCHSHWESAKFMFSTLIGRVHGAAAARCPAQENDPAGNPAVTTIS